MQEVLAKNPVIRGPLEGPHPVLQKSDAAHELPRWYHQVELSGDDPAHRALRAAEQWNRPQIPQPSTTLLTYHGSCGQQGPPPAWGLHIPPLACPGQAKFPPRPPAS